MAQLRVDNITNQNDDGPVTFDRGIIADGSKLTLKPGVISFDPPQLSTAVGVGVTIQIGFNQTMQFSGVGTIFIREGSASGSITTYFTCGVSTEANIVGSNLTIAPENDLATGTKYFVTLPSTGIANTLGANPDAITNYQFETSFDFFDIQGGDYEQVIVSPTSPTGYHKYNIFTSSGIATFSAPSSTAVDFAYVLVGGGGGGGKGYGPRNGGGGGGGAGGFVKNYNSNNLPLGTYTVTIGAGGPGTFDNPGGTTQPPTGTTPSTNATYTVFSSPGNVSSFGPTPVGTISAQGGGRAAMPSYGNPAPSYMYPWNPSTPQLFGAPGGSGGGGSTQSSSYPNPSPTIAGALGGQGYSYPSPNQQGYPGGNTLSTPNGSDTDVGGGGGGAGGSGTGAQYFTTQPNNSFPSVGYHNAGGTGGSGAPSPEFPGPGLAFLGLPTPMTNEMGPTGRLAGGGGGEIQAYPSTQWPGSSFYTPNNNVGGSGGGGDGKYGRGYPSNPYQNRPEAEAGYQNMGGGGGGGPLPAGPTGTFPTPGEGNWLGAPGGSGVMMFRYSHPGS